MNKMGAKRSRDVKEWRGGYDIPIEKSYQYAQGGFQGASNKMLLDVGVEEMYE